MAKFLMYIMVLFLDNGWNLNVTWTNDALCQYYRFCGQQSCETNGTSCQELTYNSLLSVCPSCDCKVTCIKYGNCCPHILLSLPKRTCEHSGVLNQHNSFRYVTQFADVTTDLYKVVKECPVSSSTDCQLKCLADRNMTAKMTALTVTSYDTLMTYDSIYCSEYYNDSKNVEQWYLDFDCMKTTDFNFLNSLEDIANLADRNNCSILAKHDSFAERCKLYPEVVISKCNQTGSLMTENKVVERACLSIDQPFGMFRNIFCYICNPPIGHIDVISSCLTNDSKEASLCTSMPFDQSTYPYKNIHCYRCNINISTEIVTDIHYDMNNTGNGYIYYLFTLRCEEYFKLGTYDPLHNSSRLNIANNTKDTLPFGMTETNTELTHTVPHHRPWQYIINCPNVTIFSLFFDVEQITDEAILSGCVLNRSHIHYPLKCFHRPQLIRECNVTGLVINVNPLIKLACLSLEHQNLIAYKGYYNVFCHLCNTNENTVKLCIDDNFLLLFNLEFTTMDSMINKCSTFVSHNDLTVQSILCRICTSRGSGFGDSEYRKMFMLSSYSTSITYTKSAVCLDRQMLDKRAVSIY